VCDPAFGLDRCKSRQRFREGGFFYGFAAWLRGETWVAGTTIGLLGQAGGGIGVVHCMLLEEPIDFVGFSTILRSALQ
jgi:hypothetical protein